MTPEVALELFGRAFYITVVMVTVIVTPSLLVGLVVSVFQAATQINEQTLSFLPRFIITVVTIMVTGPWLLQQVSDLFVDLMLQVPELLG
ncbi:flagellar biosynthetic protein FliQ [Teredinibacter waterburyi]|jgi:Flagellar biosynthesis pathway, component FliQ|uniref:flagellar biosynthetic protein FliQ n=1 Tax=Teredinibacter waterburyi TaxID=1500538 RepID=UPI00165EF946|nr:flagellar biosynthetic protein FliQ [Teredinibacter waterburyi]